MVIGGLLLLPALFVKFLVSRELDLLPSLRSDPALAIILFERAVILFAVAAVCVSLYEIGLSPFFSGAVHPSRSRLSLLAIGLLLSLLISLWLPLATALAVGLLVNIAIVLLYDRTLLWDVVFSSTGMAVLYLFGYLVSNLVLSGDIAGFW